MIAFTIQISNRVQDLGRMLLGKEERTGLYSHLVRSAVGTFGLKVASTGLFFIISVLLGRLLGTAGYGAYSYAIAWVSLLCVPALLGLDTLLTRNIAEYQAQSAWGLMTGLLRRANQATLIVSIGLALLAAVVSWTLAPRFVSQMLFSFWVALMLLPFMVLIRLRQATLQGLQQVVVGQLPEMLVQPILFIVLIGVVYLLFESDLTAPWVVGMNIVATGTSFLIGTRLLNKTLPQAVQRAAPVYQTREWVRSALPLLFVSGMGVINASTDILMLGAIKGAEAVGIYAVANRGAGLITFFLMSVNMPLAPTIAGLYAEGKIQRLQHVITKSARVTLVLSLPLAVSLIVFGYWLLSLVGPDFTSGRLALAILSVGQLINVAMGSVGLLLVMTGHEHDAAMGIGISAVLNVILNALLIPRWGIEGAAVATASSMILWNLLLSIWVYKRLGIHSTALGKVSLRRVK